MNCLYYVLLTASLFGLVACNPTVENVGPGLPTTDPTAEPGVVTEVGKPVGAPISKTIGTSGGTLETPDGKLTLSIPAGALSKSVDLKLQVVENKAPSGMGLAFTIEPNDTKLSKPVSFVWRYAANDISGSAPEVMGIAYQDNKGVWQGKLNNQVDKSKQTITARMPNFAHPMAWYAQYYMQPGEMRILPNQRLTFTVYFEPGRTENSSNPDDDIFVPLPNPKQGDDAIRELQQQELRNWRLNGESTFTDQRRNMIGSLSRLGQGGEASYVAPKSVPTKADNPLAVSVELNLKQKGTITMVSNLTVIDPENEFRVGSGTYKNPFVEVIAAKGEGFSMTIKENVDQPNKKAATISATIDTQLFNGTGTYVLDENDRHLSINASDHNDSYGLQWVPQPNVSKWGPLSITITEFNDKGLAVTGRLSATLHRYIESEKRWEHIDVSARFRVINNYHSGSGG